jgi:hypothetical protein
MQEALIVSHDHAVNADDGAALLKNFIVSDDDEDADALELFA